MGNYGEPLQPAKRDSSTAKPEEAGVVPSPRPRRFSTILAELGRALAATRYYESLAYRRAHHERLLAGDIPRRIFDEFYPLRVEPKRAVMDFDRRRARRIAPEPHGIRRWRHTLS